MDKKVKIEKSIKILSNLFKRILDKYSKGDTLNVEWDISLNKKTASGGYT